MRKRNIIHGCAGVLLLGFAQTANADEVIDHQCTQSSSTDVISIVICPEDVSMEEMVAAGRSFCDGRLPCGAWVWSDASMAPEEAPENHDGLTQEQVTSSKGVWVAEQEQFISIEATQ